MNCANTIYRLSISILVALAFLLGGCGVLTNAKLDGDEPTPSRVFERPDSVDDSAVETSSSSPIAGGPRRPIFSLRDGRLITKIMLLGNVGKFEVQSNLGVVFNGELFETDEVDEDVRQIYIYPPTFRPISGCTTILGQSQYKYSPTGILVGRTDSYTLSCTTNTTVENVRATAQLSASDSGGTLKTKSYASEEVKLTSYESHFFIRAEDKLQVLESK